MKIIVELILKIIVVIIPLVCIEGLLNDGIKTKSDRCIIIALSLISGIFILLFFKNVV